MVVVNHTESPVLLIREHTDPQNTENISRPPTIIQRHRQPERCPAATCSEFKLSLPSSSESIFRSEQDLSNLHPFQVPAPPPPPPLYIMSHISILPCQGLDFFLLFHVPSPFTAHTYGLVFKRPVSGISDHPCLTWKIIHFWDVRLPRLPFRDPTYFHNVSVSVTSSAYRIMQSIGSNRTATILSLHLEGCR